MYSIDPLVFIAFFSFLVVGSLYVFKTSGAPQELKEITNRSIKILIICVIASFFVKANFFSIHFMSIIKTLILNSVLFAGEIINIISGKVQIKYSKFNAFETKTLLIAPILEEYIYRGVFITYLIEHNYTLMKAVLIAPIFFSISHFHHVFQDMSLQSLFTSIFQMMFTYVFGVYSGYLFISTGSIWNSVILHSYCNLLEFPHLNLCFSGHHKLANSLYYSVGLAGFATLLNMGFMNN